MRKLIVPAIALIFIAASVSAYACGNDNGSAKKVDASKAKATTAQASVQTTDVKVETAQVTKDASSACSGVKAMQANQVKSGSCCSGMKAKATTAEAHKSADGIKVQRADARYCPATANCKGSNCAPDGKAVKATAKDKMVENTGDSQAQAASVAMAPKPEKDDK